MQEAPQRSDTKAGDGDDWATEKGAVIFFTVVLGTLLVIWLTRRNPRNHAFKNNPQSDKYQNSTPHHPTAPNDHVAGMSVLLRLQTTSTRIHNVSAGSLAKDLGWLFHPCFATRLGGVSGGRETQGWRDSSHTLMVGAGKFGSAKLPMATATYPGKPSPSQ